VAAARLDLKRAQVELKTLRMGPSKVSLGAARQAIDSARVRLAQVLGPPLASDLDAARVDIRKAEADLAVLRARGGPASATDIEIASLKVKAAEARLTSASLAKRLLTARAPLAGTITSLQTVRGAPVDSSTPIATVADLEHLAVSVDLSEFDVARVKRGLEAVVSVDALAGRSFRGKVLFVAFAGSDTSGVVTFPVQVGVSRSAGLKPGMNVSVHIIVAERRKVVQVPLEAVSHDDEDRPIVNVVDKAGEASPRRVTLGLANNKNVEIRKGLKAGERVALPESQGGGEEE
jgi:HlyD family secretion protein